MPHRPGRPVGGVGSAHAPVEGPVVPLGGDGGGLRDIAHALIEDDIPAAVHIAGVFHPQSVAAEGTAEERRPFEGKGLAGGNRTIRRGRKGRGRAGFIGVSIVDNRIFVGVFLDPVADQPHIVVVGVVIRRAGVDHPPGQGRAVDRHQRPVVPEGEMHVRAGRTAPVTQRLGFVVGNIADAVVLLDRTGIALDVIQVIVGGHPAAAVVDVEVAARNLAGNAAGSGHHPDIAGIVAPLRPAIAEIDRRHIPAGAIVAVYAAKSPRFPTRVRELQKSGRRRLGAQLAGDADPVGLAERVVVGEEAPVGPGKTHRVGAVEGMRYPGGIFEAGQPGQ